MIVHRMLVLAVTAVAVLSMSGCGPIGDPSYQAKHGSPPGVTAESPAPKRLVPISDLKAAKALAAQNNEFAFKMVSALRIGSSTKNELVSPTSLGLCLSMLYNGLEGESAKGLATALQLQGMKIDALNKANTDLLGRLQGNPGADISIANGIWVLDVTLAPEFVESMTKRYDARISKVPPTIAQARKEINDWVEEKTKGRVKIAVTDLDPIGAVTLVNAITFDGDWQVPFVPESTRPQPFHGPNGTTEVDMMQSHHYDLDCAEVGGVKAISLQYKERQYRMVLMLPVKGKPVSSVVSSNAWKQVNAKISTREARIRIPRFKITSGYDLAQTLKSLGAASMFAPSHDFSHMVQDQVALYVEKALHSAYISVDEKGTSAAAITIGEAPKGEDRPAKPFEFIADRPFVFAIVENATGQILFLGVVNEPTRARGK